MSNRLVLPLTCLCLLVARSGWTQPPPEKPAEQPAKSVARGDLYYSKAEGAEGGGTGPIWSLVYSELLQQDVVRMTAKQLLKEEPSQLPRVEFDVQHLPDFTRVTVSSFDEKIPADKVLTNFVNELRTRWIELAAPRELLERAANELNQAQRLQADLDEKQVQLANFAKERGLDLDPKIAAEKRLQVETERQRLTVEREGLLARRDVLQKQLLQTAAKAEQAAAQSSPIVDELLKSVESRKKILEFHQAQFNVANATVESLERAKDELAKAELELARHRQSIAMSAGKDRIDELQRRLDDTVIELAENEARIKALEQLATNLEFSPRLDALRRQVEQLEQQVTEARRLAEQLQSQYRAYREPRITLIRTK